MTEFRFHPEAEIDLNEIWDLIAEDSIDAADRARDNIFAAIQDLAQTPLDRRSFGSGRSRFCSPQHIATLPDVAAASRRRHNEPKTSV